MRLSVILLSRHETNKRLKICEFHAYSIWDFQLCYPQIVKFCLWRVTLCCSCYGTKFARVFPACYLLTFQFRSNQAKIISCSVFLRHDDDHKMLDSRTVFNSSAYKKRKYCSFYDIYKVAIQYYIQHDQKHKAQLFIKHQRKCS